MKAKARAAAWTCAAMWPRPGSSTTVRIIAPEGMRLEGEGQGRGLDVRGDVAEAGVLNAGAI